MRARVLVLTILLALSMSGVAYVQAPAGARAPFTGPDVVILIDQSGSMWGLPGIHPQLNDQYGHRIGQTKNIIYRLAEHVENTPFVHRVSVIDFGDKASLAFSNHVMRFDPAQPGLALMQTKPLVDRFVTAKRGDDWENTNTPEGMTLGLREYEKMVASAPKDGRRRVMLIITDGRANVPGSSKADMERFVRDSAAELGKKDVEVWVVGLNDADNYWNEGDGAFWESVAGPGRARLAQTAKSGIFTVVQDIIDEWLNAKSNLIVGNEYDCPPYLGRIIFNVNFGTPRAPISISDPNGNLIPISAGGPSSSPGTTARFSVDDPAPGIYKINKDPSSSYHIAVEEYAPNIKRLVPSSAANIDSETRVVFQASDSKGVPLQMISQWPITASIVITSPSGGVDEVPASFDGNGKFKAKWKPSELGNYSLKLKGLITLKNGTLYDVFRADGHSYTDQLAVNALTPYRLRLEDPDPEGSLRVTSGDTSADIKLSMVDSKDSPVANLSGIVNDPTTWLSLQLIDPSGAPLAAPVIPLAYDGAGSFEATVPVKLDWRSGEGWWMPGQLSFRVIPQSAMLGENFLDSIHLPPDVETLRAGGDPMTVGPLDVKFSLLILGGGLLVLFAALAGLLWYLLFRLLPGLLIWRADSSRQRRVELKIYNGADDPNGDFAKRFSAGTWDRFKYDRQISLSVGGEEFIATKFRVTRAPSPDQVMAQVKYCWQNQPDKEYTVMLSKGRAERLRGLPDGDFLLALDLKQ